MSGLFYFLAILFGVLTLAGYYLAPEWLPIVLVSAGVVFLVLGFLGEL